MAVNIIIKGVKLNAEEVSRLSQLQGTITLGGKTLLQALEDLVNSWSWQNAGSKFNSKGESIREQMIEDIVTRYKRQAQQIFLQENQGFNARIKEDKENDRKRTEYMQNRFSRGVNLSDL